MSKFKNLTAYELHKHLVNEYILTNKGSTKLLTRDTSRDKRDIDVIKENHKFLWGDDSPVDTWEKQLAKKYYDKLFKEYCICDLSRYKENKVALRWRTEQEVISGKGQFDCGNKRCSVKDCLKSWEVNFAYKEDGERKNALVKLRLCVECSKKLNHHSKKREVKRLKHKGKKSKGSRKQSSNRNESGNVSEDDDDNKEPSTSEATTSNAQEEKTSMDPDNELWKKGHMPEEKSREEEFEEYLEDLLM